MDCEFCDDPCENYEDLVFEVGNPSRHLVFHEFCFWQVTKEFNGMKFMIWKATVLKEDKPK